MILRLAVIAPLLALYTSVAHAEGTSVKSDVAGFKKAVAPFLTKYCADCHSGKTPEANLDLTKIDPDILEGRDFEIWRLVAERLKYGEMPPKDYTQPKPAELKAAASWMRTELRKTQLPGATTISKLVLPEYGNYVDHQELFSGKAGPVIPTNPRLWRIRPSIYETMARKLVRGKPSGLSDPLGLRAGQHFKDFASPYFIDEPTANMLLSNAAKIVDQQLNSRHHFRELRALISQKEVPTEKQVITAIQFQFRLALHRSATEKEVSRYVALRDKVARKSGHAIASKTMLMAIPMLPEALFRFELGQGPVDKFGRRRLSQREIAFAISFALDEQVDEALLKAAATKKLATREHVQSYVEKRLDDFDANPRVMQFFREYFGYPNVLSVFKDQPEKGLHEPRLLLRDMELLVRHVVERDRDVLKELLTTNKFFVAAKRNKETGKLEPAWDRRRPLMYQTVYGLPIDWRWSGGQPIALPKDERAGVLTHPAWLAAWGGNFDNHPVQRGKWIRTHLLGGTVPDVPIGVDARIPEDEHKQLGERLAKVTRTMECWRCHKKMNPLGIPFEQFDHYGRYRRFEVMRPVKVEGAVTYTGVPEIEGKVDDIVELMNKLAASKHVEQVFVRHAFRYFMGRNETLGDARTLEQAYEAYRKSNGSFKALVVSLLSSDSFLYRQADTVNKISAKQ